jgi:hypothetical protein
MLRGCAIAPNKNTTPSDGERDLIIWDCHVSSVSGWLVSQKPKIRVKFMQFPLVVTEYYNASGNIAERFARDIVSTGFHPVLRRVVDDSSDEFSDVLYMQRSNVRASVPSIRDMNHRLIKAITQEDHVYSRPVQPKHEIPKAAAAIASVAPGWQIRSSQSDRLGAAGWEPSRRRHPRASPAGSGWRAQFIHNSAIERTTQSRVYNILNDRTRL